ncbi:MAG: cytochrome ubiquinol oxidase subunit I [Clostridium sp.]|nr:cytochrome ubiquinol oxidase subunit I [Prevotella sp.]MCM1429468.1 cytochrome ubiquinol oxidase subunit I [Clostridium sp.]MCM1475498.1 cytochrome ubiquinol oxidase subunit I [Muribaculaceae bacterium]
MNDLITVVDWSRWQFALTAIYHWLFVPLTLGLSVIVGVMETAYYRTGDKKWLKCCKFWMTLFGINFAIGVATGIILEFEFGTNWSNYSWFVGDIFGAPLAIEGLLAFFMEATFVAVMFFGWNKVSPRFHLVSTWLTCLGATISSLWILVANAWMQLPVGMEFDPEQMRNVMDNFWALFSPVAMHKFFHAVFSGWALAGIFVIGVSCWFLLKNRNVDFAILSIKTGGWVGLIGMLLTMYTGDGSAVDVATYQPMKLAAMEGLYDGAKPQSIVAVGILNSEKRWNNDEKPYKWAIEVPYGLSLLARHNPEAFVPGITDIIEGRDINAEGDTINTISYEERMACGRAAQRALRDFDTATREGNDTAKAEALSRLKADYDYFGYGYFDNVEEAIPPVAATFYSFRIMVILGSYFMLFLIVALILAYKKRKILAETRWLQWIMLLTMPLIWICSEAGWAVAEVGRQPWTVQNLLPTKAAISAIPESNVILTFWMFAVIFTVLLAAELSIMVRYIKKTSKTDLSSER